MKLWSVVGDKGWSVRHYHLLVIYNKASAFTPPLSYESLSKLLSRTHCGRKEHMRHILKHTEYIILGNHRCFEDSSRAAVLRWCQGSSYPLYDAMVTVSVTLT
jgi:hypothetical protein